MTFGERLKFARKSKGLTQRNLANAIGVVTGTVQQYELGKRRPRTEQIQAIAHVLDVTPDYLLGFEKEQIIIPGRLKIITVNDPDAENIQYRIEAEDEEAFNQGLRIVEGAGISINTNTPFGRISANLDKLNDKGQRVAVERVEELTKIPEYRRPQEPPKDE